ncbi:T9SS type A sorting domain-containing protein [Aequorivita marisscotiae]|uniref:T9SS type A sorting domain-containing protein n=1 Tax=Aequorivita marisscotiae TaxID=3040348 RepID=A0ABY8L137_9FLAO|nr:T9SS type A sorting domain-containing protein [Aequorivita sp. Ant34-E75]WGF93687.1 T9SS type A sorting domain-containing protein [Aequorivita sp. Ant34-E75]
MKTLLYILILNIGAISYAQDPQLAGVDWYLQDLIINGEHYPPPRNSEIQNVQARFYAISNGDSADAFITFVCNEIYGLLIYDEFNPVFSFTYQENTFITCTLQVNEDYEGLYFNFFYAPFGSIYNYSITTDTNGYKVLLLTSPTGDKAIYGDNILSSEDFYSSQFSIHPNPAQNELFIIAQNTTENLTLKIFNIVGKLLSTQNIMLQDQKAIDVSQLVSGIYFLNIEEENGNTTTKKFIKE